MTQEQFSYAKKISGTREGWEKLRDKLAKRLQAEYVIAKFKDHVDADFIREVAEEWTIQDHWKHVAAVAIDVVVSDLAYEPMREAIEAAKEAYARGEYMTLDELKDMGDE